MHAQCVCEKQSFAAMSFVTKAVLHHRRGPLVLRQRRATAVRAWVVFVALIAGFAEEVFGTVLTRCAKASRLCFKASPSSQWLGSTAVRERTALRCSLAKGGTSQRLVPCLLRVVRASWRSALAARFTRFEAACLSQVRRGKLALMVRNQSVLHQPPNPSIERTSNGLRPSAAAHVQR